MTPKPDPIAQMRLMKAAPEMLAMLHRLLAYVNRSPQGARSALNEDLNALIAKAEGRS